MSGWDDYPSGRKNTLPANWKMLRRVVLRRDKGRCQIAGPRCLEIASEVDHVGDSRDHRVSNLRAVCKPCHATRTAKQGNAARKPRPTRKRPEERHPGMRHE